MKELNYEQRSEEWFAARMGKLTGSKFPKLMPTPKQRKSWNDTQLAILYEAATEILTGQREETYQSPAMAWGTLWEDTAREQYSIVIEEEIRACGFFEYSEFIGSSPDGIYSGVWEGKCPTSKKHLQYYLDPELLWKDYGWQLVGHMLCTGKRTGALTSYDPRFPAEKQLAVYIPEMDIEPLIKQLEERLSEAVDFVKKIIAV